ncbi:DNA-directed RNA polymerase core subunit rpc40 [Mycoemilia scoparia]|uniref:DNA-directed RNA polymerases I and III subunit RPAC1 n=1 Tax=Mycoemilia scoparia TaxID=417184 RepID=A0A9W8A9W8_9FUNG|nr:DNA-directed RNA polymerase core subunit rpc40 [Mycoemilia scoparia]
MATKDRNNVVILSDHVENIHGAEFPHNFPGEDLSFDIEKLRKSLNIKIWKISNNEMEFDLVGADAAIANTLRRIMISEIPLMAIEKVYMMNNTGVIQDEVLAQRLGLLPIKADPKEFAWKRPEDPPTDLNTIVFRLDITCKHNPTASPDETDPKKKYINSSVYSSDLVWEPKGDQAEKFADSPIRPVHDNILVAKLRPGQEISCELHCEKGIGEDHAKFSPVATASYRLLPTITILKDITGDDAIKFQKCFPSGVIDIVEENGVKKAKVVNPRKDTVSREVLRHKEFEGKVALGRVRDHFIFRIESTGVIPPAEILSQAIDVLAEKCRTVRNALGSIKHEK